MPLLNSSYAELHDNIISNSVGIAYIVLYLAVVNNTVSNSAIINGIGSTVTNVIILNSE